MSGALKDTGCSPAAHAASLPGDGLCEHCGRPRCSARSKGSGATQRCRRNPIPGGRTCKMHGSATEAAKEAAAANVQERKADVEIRKLWVGLDQATPVTDPVASMARLAGALEQLLDEVGRKVEDVKTIAAGDSLAQVRGELVFLERTAALLGRTLDSMARLGIAERQVQLQADQAELVTSAFRAAVGAVASSLLTPGDRDLMVRTFLTGLGRGPEVLEVEAGGGS